MRRLKILLITFSLIGCGTIPEKPSIELCVLDVPAGEAICGQTKAEDLYKASKENLDSIASVIIESPNAIRKPILYLDKGISFRPDEWKTLKLYIDQLERYIEFKCQAQ